ncbi:MAG: hypothetical protein ACRDQX_03165 [Pseudonocardiaceae bacterium]
MPGRHRFRSIATLHEILGRRARTPATTTWGCTSGLADGSTGISHSVTEQAFVEGRRAGERYVARCGAVRVRPTRRTAPARYHCPACERDS